MSLNSLNTDYRKSWLNPQVNNLLAYGNVDIKGTLLCENIENVDGALACGSLYVQGSTQLVSNVRCDTNLTVVGNTILSTQTPPSTDATGTQGQIAWDADYIYICTATDTWKRVAIDTWT